MIISAQLTVLLADHKKFGRESLFRYADLDAIDAIDVLVTDEGLSANDARRLESQRASKSSDSEARRRAYSQALSHTRGCRYRSRGRW